ncbi:hypothetical protein [Mycobacterium sp. 29Ha]|uniref:hypothetical protein n=1 Tax=Mycobacterium sp. 29Ha TaxID=2939268 RepID=UPI0029393800|nr:hypothetical protein [Mycobacterium sp. 29Ha]MDV3133319.1 hypothetical protein [Mycobacterium sp. 29Ha]
MPVVQGFQQLWPNPFGMDATPTGVMPWLAPGQVAREALACLEFPPRACQTGSYFDAADFYSQWPVRQLKAVERAIRDAGPRLEWRLERVWDVDVESSPEEVAEYSKAAKPIGGYRINPRCLDSYASTAWELAERAGMDPDALDTEDQLATAPKDAAVFDAALDWARAGVVILQQSLPWPFTGVLAYDQLDNRPAHRVLYAYARLLKVRSKRHAQPWFRAMLYMNPMDNMGARLHL